MRRIDYDVVGPNAAIQFNLSIRDGTTGKVELFRNVSVVPGNARQVDKVLTNDSLLVNMTGALPTARPAKHPNPDPTNRKVTCGPTTSSHQLEGGERIRHPTVGGSTSTILPARKGNQQGKGLYALKKADLFNILCIPPYLANGDVDPTLPWSAPLQRTANCGAPCCWSIRPAVGQTRTRPRTPTLAFSRRHEQQERSAVLSQADATEPSS